VFRWFKRAQDLPFCFAGIWLDSTPDEALDLQKPARDEAIVLLPPEKKVA
jgi:hypothetical protein